MRLIADGIVDREGVTGLARRLGYSERHLNRLLLTEVGAGPLALARASRAHTARLLIETTDLAFSDVAFGAGFSSIRQFNDTVRSIFAISPTELRRSRHGSREHLTGSAIALRLPYRAPFHAPGVFGFLQLRAVAGVEEPMGTGFRRTLRLSHGPCSLELSPRQDHVRCVVRLADLRDLGTAVGRARRLLDLDADPIAVAEHLSADPVLGPAVSADPGRRVPGCVDGAELALRAVLGQQISVAGARVLTGRLVAEMGEPLHETDGALTTLFPTPASIAAADPTRLGMPEARGRTLLKLAEQLASGALLIDAGADHDEVAAGLTAIPGIGPWTVAYVAMRALGDPDAFLPSDLGARRALRMIGLADDPASVMRMSQAWRPWRAYALQYLWSGLPKTSASRRPSTCAPQVHEIA
jgi:AraC family transcriptional regulator of adaptative response / DNA-3-methyladenine glycosylase II